MAMKEQEYTCIICFSFMEPKTVVVRAINPMDAVAVLQASEDLAHINTVLVFEGRLNAPKLSIKVRA